MGHGYECFVVLGIKKEMPTRYNEYCGADTPILPSGRLLNTFGYQSPEDKTELRSSLELMGDEGKFLIGYQIGYLDHHNAVELPRANDSGTRSKLIHELQEAGMNLSDSDISLYLHMDSDQFQH